MGFSLQKKPWKVALVIMSFSKLHRCQGVAFILGKLTCANVEIPAALLCWAQRTVDGSSQHCWCSLEMDALG